RRPGGRRQQLFHLGARTHCIEKRSCVSSGGGRKTGRLLPNLHSAPSTNFESEQTRTHRRSSSAEGISRPRHQLQTKKRSHAMVPAKGNQARLAECPGEKPRPPIHLQKMGLLPLRRRNAQEPLN